MKTIFSLFLGFHSINVPSEWGLLNPKYRQSQLLFLCFHSINVPSEWGQVLEKVLNNQEIKVFPFN